MKYLLIVSILISGCVSSIPVSDEEYCARRSMVLAGFTGESSSAVAYGSNGGSAVVNGWSSSIQCVVPKTKVEKCEIEKAKPVASKKYEYNDGIGTRHLLTFTGYFFFIAPGIIAHLIYDKNRDTEISEIEKVQAQTKDNCVSNIKGDL